jgi:hypothetical protein
MPSLSLYSTGTSTGKETKMKLSVLIHLVVIAALIGWAAVDVYAQKVEEAELTGTLTSYNQQQKDAGAFQHSKPLEERGIDWNEVSRQDPLEEDCGCKEVRWAEVTTSE